MALVPPLKNLMGADSSLPKVFLTIFVFLPLTSDSFKVIGPESPFIVTAGMDVLLPCHLSNNENAEDMEIRWFSDSFYAIVHLYRDKTDQPKHQMATYSGRTEFIKEKITSGSVALRICNISVSDEGEYGCYFESDTYFNAAKFEIRVTALGSDPKIYVEGFQNGGIKAVCKSVGWYPEPKIQMKQNAHNSTPGSEMKTQTENGLFNIEYYKIITEKSDRTFSCVIGTGFTRKKMESAIYLSDSLFKMSHSWIPSVSSIILVLIIITGCVAYHHLKKPRPRERGDEESVPMMEAEGSLLEELKSKIKRHAKEKEEYMEELDRHRNELDKQKEKYDRDVGKISTELAWRREATCAAPFSPTDVSLDPATAHPDLILSEDRKSVSRGDNVNPTSNDPQRFDIALCILGSQGFAQGRHSWVAEVKAGLGMRWAVGVAGESVRRKGEFQFMPKEKVWAVGMVVDQFRAFTSPLTHLTLDSVPRKIKVFLDYEGQVAFYNADNMSHIYTFIPKFTENIFPFIWTMDLNTSISLCLCEPVKG